MHNNDFKICNNDFEMRPELAEACRIAPELINQCEIQEGAIMDFENMTPQEQATYTEHIKANLPASLDDEKQGAGEGVFILVDPATKRAYDTDEAGTKYKGVLDNDSLYYPGLMHGTVLSFEMRGEKRPVVSFNWLVENYGNPAPEWTGGPENE